MSVKSYSADRLGEVPPLRNRGPWAAGTYPAGSIVTYQGYTYMSVVKTSATPQLPTADYTQAFPTLPANDSAPWSYTGTPLPTVGATSLFTGTTGLGGATSCLIIAGANQGGSSHYAELTKTFISAGTITFADACSSEGGWDHGRFFIDGVQQRDITGAIPWAANSYSVAAGSHTFKWLYVKDGSGDAGLDAYAVTNIVLAGTGTGATVPWVAIGLDAETVRDTMAAALVQGPGVVVTVSDPLDTITLSSQRTYLGKNAVGASWQTLSNTTATVKKITAPSTGGLLVNIGAHVRSNVDALSGFGVLVYSDVSGTPDKILAMVEIGGDRIGFQKDTTPMPSGGRWFSMPINVPLDASTDYWIGLFSFDVAVVDLAYDTGGSDRTYNTGNSWILDWGRTGYTATTTTRDHSIRGYVIA